MRPEAGLAEAALREAPVFGGLGGVGGAGGLTVVTTALPGSALQASGLSSPLGVGGLWPPFPELAPPASLRHPHPPHAAAAAAMQGEDARYLKR